MRGLKGVLVGFIIWFGLTISCYGYEIVQVTNTPELIETHQSIAIFGSTVYAVWWMGDRWGNGDVYFDKSTDLGKTWGVYKKIIEGVRDTDKIFVAKNGRLIIPCYTEGGDAVLKVSDNDGETFYDLELPEEIRSSLPLKFAVNKSGNIIYANAYSTQLGKSVITKSFDGGATFSEPIEIPGVTTETWEISEDGKYVYIFYIDIVYVEDYLKTVPFLMRSTDYGETFEEPRPLFIGHHWSYNLRSCIGENGEVYLVWDHDSYGRWNIKFLQSIDYGVTFSGATISDPSGAQSTNPAIAVDKRGYVYAAFLKDGLCYDKGKKEYTTGYVLFGEDKKIVEGYIMGWYETLAIAVSPEGDKCSIMWIEDYNEGNSRDLFSTTFPVNQPPVFDPPIGNREVNEGSTLDFIVSATDPDGDHLDTIDASGLPVGARFELLPRSQIYPNSTIAGRFVWTPNYNQAGIYEDIKFTVTDGVSITEETITITVNNTNRSPIITPIGNKSVNEGALLQFIVQATDPDGDRITYSMLNAPSGATINANTGLFKWTPNYQQAGRYIVTFVASDGDLSAGETIVITVKNIAKPDLVCGNILYWPSQPKAGYYVIFRVPITNAGGSKAGRFMVSLNIAGETKTTIVYVLYPRMRTYATFWWRAKRGTYTATATADSTNVIQEENENNNTSTKEIIVR